MVCKNLFRIRKTSLTFITCRIYSHLQGLADTWIRQGEKKIVLKIENEELMKRLYEAFKYKQIPCALVTDAGFTELPPGTTTALGVGPWKGEEIDVFTKTLKLL